MKKRTLTNDEINLIIELFKSGTKIRVIYNKTKISPSIIEKILIENGFSLPTKFKYSVNHSIFNCVDNEEKAYWLGFLFADGHVRKRVDRNIFELKLKISKKDETHLIEFKQFLSSTHPITNNISKVKYPNFVSVSENVSLSVYSKQIFDDLCSLGCTSNKTYRIGKPNIKDEYFRHFIRGYFDGDGCISTIKNETSRTLNFTSSSIKILEWINDILSKNKITSKQVKKNKNTYRLNWGDKDDILLIYHFLYDGSNLFLKRKKLKYEQMIDSYKPIKVIQKNIDGTLFKNWDDVSVASQHFGINKKLILRCCNNEVNFAGGYKWEFSK